MNLYNDKVLWISLSVMCFTVVCLTILVGDLLRKVSGLLRDRDDKRWPFENIRPGEPVSSYVGKWDANGSDLPRDGIYVIAKHDEEGKFACSVAATVASGWNYPCVIVLAGADKPLDVPRTSVISAPKIWDAVGLESRYAVCLVRNGYVVEATGKVYSPSDLRTLFSFSAEYSYLTVASEEKERPNEYISAKLHH